MDNKNELSDIVLEKSDEKMLKVKRILIIISILIIIFLIVLLSMKLLNRSDDEKTPNLVLPPEPTSSTTKVSKDEELFKQVPIIEEKVIKKEDIKNIVKKIKNKVKKENKVIAIPQQKEVKSVVKPIMKQSIKKSNLSVKKTIKKEVSTKISKGVYIQVGATSRLAPNQKFLKKISREKFSYKLLPIKIKGKKITKILVGPFKNRTKAKQNLLKVRKTLNKHAFIYMMK